jgi:hypothetical protein
MINTLRSMLTYCRPAGSSAERLFIERYILPVPNVYRAIGENYIVTIGEASPILFSCHTDTVHRQSGRQTVHETALGIAQLSQRSLAAGVNCLGADDTAGVWLCLELIAAGVPGTYIFHACEERGGIGSSTLARSPEGEEWLGQFKFAIAFDRRGVSDVITHQSHGRTASDDFAVSMGAMLSAAGLPAYAPAHGIYTDTAEYADIIGECTNLSVGYRDEHTTRETLDLRHVQRLRDALVAADYSLLVAAREPGTDDPYDDDLWAVDDTSWFRYLQSRDTKPAISYRLDPEYDEIQAQLTADLLARYRRTTH